MQILAVEFVGIGGFLLHESACDLETHLEVAGGTVIADSGLSFDALCKDTAKFFKLLCTSYSPKNCV